MKKIIHKQTKELYSLCNSQEAAVAILDSLGFDASNYIIISEDEAEEPEPENVVKPEDVPYEIRRKFDNWLVSQHDSRELAKKQLYSMREHYLYYITATRIEYINN